MIYKTALALILFAICFLLLDRILIWKHGLENGPYEIRSVEVVDVERRCVRRKGRRVVDMRIYIVWDDEVLELMNPFIGFYPLSVCFLDKHYALYDRRRISSLRSGSGALFLIGKDGSFYLGRLSNAFSFSVIIVLVVVLVFFMKIRGGE